MTAGSNETQALAREPLAEKRLVWERPRLKRIVTESARNNDTGLADGFTTS
jgi:hypothetical protein